MPQTRLFFQAHGPQATQAFQHLERALEEDGVPISMWEVDEDADLHEVSVYVLDGDTQPLRERMETLLGDLPFPVEIGEEEVPDIDWVTHSLEGLHAVRAGGFFIHGSHDSDKVKPGDLAIQIDAGLAFGTGHHGTTSGCLEMISRVLKSERPRNALDLGTGSAVLAIAIAKLRRIPVRAGGFFIHGSHDSDKVKPGDLAIQIDAGLAFGTGHHGTTSGCLEMISRVLKSERPRNALDLGTGSAVLAIAIAKLRRIPVLATDIDPIAVRVARENVAINEVSAWVETATAPGFHNPIFRHRRPFGLIVANILARPLMKLAPDMARHLKPGGSIILSGILDKQRDQVVAAYAGQGFRHITTLHREGWVTIHMKR